MKELQRTLDHDEKLKDFLFSKSNERAFSATHFEEDEKQKGKRAAEEKVRSSMYSFILTSKLVHPIPREGGNVINKLVFP